MEIEKFEQLVLSKVPPRLTPFPMVTYDPDGDCIEFLLSSESYYAERVDLLVTVYYSHESNEIVGALVKGVCKFIREVLQKVPGFKIEIRDGRIKLEYLFTARLWSERSDGNETQNLVYQRLRAVAEESDAEADVGDLSLV